MEMQRKESTFDLTWEFHYCKGDQEHGEHALCLDLCLFQHRFVFFFPHTQNHIQKFNEQNNKSGAVPAALCNSVCQPRTPPKISKIELIVTKHEKYTPKIKIRITYIFLILMYTLFIHLFDNNYSINTIHITSYYNYLDPIFKLDIIKFRDFPMLKNK